jgi:TfoX/Sxy family transcriptional regulator of competence genes
MPWPRTVGVEALYTGGMGLRVDGPADAPAAYAAPVTYDEDLAERIRELVANERGLSERRMFGGLAFLVGGNMAIAASREGGILVRVGPEQSERLVATTKATVAVMGGRAMAGWLRVDGADVRTRPQLSKWVQLGVTFARSLPSKR